MFEQYLQDRYLDLEQDVHYLGLPKSYAAWVASLTTDELIHYANGFAKEAQESLARDIVHAV